MSGGREVGRRVTATSCGQRDQNARPGASAESGGRMGPRTLGRGHSPCRNKEEEKKKGRRPKDLFGRRPEKLRGFIPVAPVGARPRDLDANQADNMTPPLSCIRLDVEISIKKNMSSRRVSKISRHFSKNLGKIF